MEVVSRNTTGVSEPPKKMYGTVPSMHRKHRSKLPVISISLSLSKRLKLLLRGDTLSVNVLVYGSRLSCWLSSSSISSSCIVTSSVSPSRHPAQGGL